MLFTWPAVGSVSPDSMCMTVLFPDPLGPNSPRTSPEENSSLFPLEVQATAELTQHLPHDKKKKKKSMEL